MILNVIHIIGTSGGNIRLPFINQARIRSRDRNVNQIIFLWSSKFASLGRESGAVESCEISSKSATVSAGLAIHAVVQASLSFVSIYSFEECQNSTNLAWYLLACIPQAVTNLTNLEIVRAN